MMHMWYWFGINLEEFLFPGYKVTTVGSFIGTCCGLIVLAIVYEGMKILQIKLRNSKLAASLSPDSQRNNENTSLLSRISLRSFKTFTSYHCENSVKWLLEISHWLLHTFFGYLLMLSVMTYNGYISIALILGSCLGYWIFGPTLIQMNITQFRAKSRVIKCTAHCADSVIIPNRRESSSVSVVEIQVPSTKTETSADIHLSQDTIE